MAAILGHTETVNALLDAGANIEAKDIGGYTALLVATIKGQKTVNALLAAGANPDTAARYFALEPALKQYSTFYKEQGRPDPAPHCCNRGPRRNR